MLSDIPVPAGLFPDRPGGDGTGGPPTDPPDAAPQGAVTAAQAAADRSELLSGDTDRIEAQVLKILAAAQHREVEDLLAEGRSEDAGVVLDSMDAVFVVQIVEQALGGPALTLRGNSQPEDFRGSRALARLLRRLLRAHRVTA